jgi:phosphoribosylformimino-5-aminoimidazole carboxamide ribotide isomerase
MEVIPVIDLKAGVVVRARHGDRAAYRPIETPLSRSSEAVAVVAGLLGVFPFAALYVADLDAIEGRSGNRRAIEAVAAAFPRLRMWIDDGCADEAAARAFLAADPQATLVIGAESQRDARQLSALADCAGRVALSLDFRGDRFLGPRALLDPALWPARVIVMTLARIGGLAGPDLARLADIRAKAGGRAVYLAGGVRGRADIEAAAAAGAAGVLVASALHDGRLGTADLAELLNAAP